MQLLSTFENRRAVQFYLEMSIAAVLLYLFAPCLVKRNADSTYNEVGKGKSQLIIDSLFYSYS